jgi:hypothetical protein
MNSIVSPYTKKDDEHTLKISLTKNTMYFNRYKNIIQKEDIAQHAQHNLESDVEIIGLFKIANLQFLQNKFSYNIVLEQAKVFMDDRIIDYSIIDDPDGKISESVSVSENDGEYYQESIDSSKRDFF